MRFGAVSYLNARPLIEGLEPLVLDAPSALALRVERGELDVSLLPVIAGESLGLERVGSLGIAAEGAVDSVLVFTRCPLGECRTLRLDPASRTSNVLAQLILAEVHEVELELVDGEADAELLIGDAALQRALDGEPSLDLASEWTRWSGLPFVFAAWYGDPASEAALEQAYRRGRDRIEQYAANANLSLPAEALSVYLRERIRFRIGPREEQGLQLFLELSRKHGLL